MRANSARHSSPNHNFKHSYINFTSLSQQPCFCI